MKFLGRLFFVLLLTGNLAYMGALSLHIVRSPGKTALVAKGQTTLQDTYIDTRGWTLSDVREHVAVVADINRAGKSRKVTRWFFRKIGRSSPGAMAPSRPALR